MKRILRKAYNQDEHVSVSVTLLHWHWHSKESEWCWAVLWKVGGVRGTHLGVFTLSEILLRVVVEEVQVREGPSNVLLDF
jgi:hypothetical protein